VWRKPLPLQAFLCGALMRFCDTCYMSSLLLSCCLQGTTSVVTELVHGAVRAALLVFVYARFPSCGAIPSCSVSLKQRLLLHAAYTAVNVALATYFSARSAPPVAQLQPPPASTTSSANPSAEADTALGSLQASESERSLCGSDQSVRRRPLYVGFCQHYVYAMKLQGEPEQVMRLYGADLSHAHHQRSSDEHLTAIYLRAGCIEVVFEVLRWPGGAAEDVRLSPAQVAEALGLPPSAADGVDSVWVVGDATAQEVHVDVSTRVLWLGAASPEPLRLRLSGPHVAVGWDALGVQGWELLLRSRGRYLPVSVRAAAATAEGQAAAVVEITSLNGLREGCVWVSAWLPALPWDGCTASLFLGLLVLYAPSTADDRTHVFASFHVQVDLRCRGRPMASVPLLAVADARVAAELRRLQQRLKTAQEESMAQAAEWKDFIYDLGAWFLLTAPQPPQPAQGDTVWRAAPSAERQEALRQHLESFAKAHQLTALLARLRPSALTLAARKLFGARRAVASGLAGAVAAAGGLAASAQQAVGRDLGSVL
jgi:hypothetical protein